MADGKLGVAVSRPKDRGPPPLSHENRSRYVYHGHAMHKRCCGNQCIPLIPWVWHMQFATTQGNGCVDWQYMIGERWQK